MADQGNPASLDPTGPFPFTTTDDVGTFVPLVTVGPAEGVAYQVFFSIGGVGTADPATDNYSGYGTVLYQRESGSPDVGASDFLLTVNGNAVSLLVSFEGNKAGISVSATGFSGEYRHGLKVLSVVQIQPG